MTILLPGMPASYGMPIAMSRPVFVSSLSQVPVGAVPVSQDMLAQALGQSGIGAQLVQQDPPSVIGSVLKGAAIGGAAGAAFGVIPFLPLGLISGGLIGAGVGAMIGLVKGIVDRRHSDQIQTLTPAQQTAMAQAQVAGLPLAGAQSVAMNAPTTTEKIVITPAMRQRAARVHAAWVATQRHDGRLPR